MKKILGLDLGTNSIGWALVNEAENSKEQSDILKLGVRVIRYDNFTNAEGKELKGDADNFFKIGKSVTPNANRTQSRGMRRNLQRYKLRRSALIFILKKSGIITDDTILTENGNKTTFETYRLRAKAASEEITLEQFARVLLQINKKRGYKSNRKTKSEAEGQSIDGMNVAKNLYKNDLTPGQYLLQLVNEGEYSKLEFYRSDLQAEFDKVWNTQMHFYPNILTDNLKEKFIGKNKSQTWAICQKPFNIVGIKRTTKGDEQRKEILTWRSDALTKKMNLEELAIVLQEINGQINSSSGYLGAIGDHSKELYFNHLTVGQYKMAELDKNPNCNLKNQVFYRQDYLDEFECIWEKQAKYHTELTPELKTEIRDCVIFYQRRLKSQKGLISICELEGKEKEIEVDGKKKVKLVGPRVCPKSSPVYQYFRIWQRFNDVTINGSPLSEDDKNILFAELSIKKELSKKEILKLLYKNAKDLDLNFEKLEGCRTQFTLFNAYRQIVEQSGHGEHDFSKMSASKIMDLVTNVFKTIGISTNILKFDSCAENVENQPLYRLWHLLYSYEDDNSKSGNDKLITKLGELYGFAPEYAKIIANITFEPDYGNLSTKAIRKIMPFMQESNQYSDACIYAGYNHSKRSLTKEQIANKVLKNKLDLLPRNILRNPIVEKILNQMVNVVNGIVDTYGKPDEIRIELARELKKSQQERKDTADAISKNTKERNRIKAILSKSPFNLTHVTEKAVLRYRLYEELATNGYKTLYSSTYVKKEDVLNGELFNIEHIIPKAKLFDDSFSNKTLELKSLNIEKSNATAFDFVKTKYGTEGENSIDKYKTRINKLYKDKIISKAKHDKLLMKEKDIPSGFIDRELRDSQYIAKKAREILEDLVSVVTPTTGSITARLREDWQIVDVMKELNLPKYRELGMTHYDQDSDGRQIERINDDWTKRNDHRHHAMDALTIAFTKKSIIQYLNNLNARIGKSIDDHIDLSNYNFSNIKPEDRTAVEYAIEEKEMHRAEKGKLLFNTPMSNFRSKAKQQLENILISVKASNKVTTVNINKAKNNVETTILTKDGEERKIKGQIVKTPRGQMHNDSIYGSIKRYVNKEEKVGSNFDAKRIATVSNKKYREALLTRLYANNCDATKAFTKKNALENNPIWLNHEHSICVPPKVKTVTLETIYTTRKKLEPALFKDSKGIDIFQKKLDKEKIEFNDSDAKCDTLLNEAIDFIVDKAIQKLIIEEYKKTRKIVDEFNKTANENKKRNVIDETFNHDIWLNQAKGIAIKRVTVTAVNNATALHDKHDQFGEIVLDKNGKKTTFRFCKYKQQSPCSNIL